MFIVKNYCGEVYLWHCYPSSVDYFGSYYQDVFVSVCTRPLWRHSTYVLCSLCPINCNKYTASQKKCAILIATIAIVVREDFHTLGIGKNTLQLFVIYLLNGLMVS